MRYKISTLASMTGLSAYTLRYYEKAGLIRDIERDENGIRIYTDFDLEMIRSIECLKSTGMTLKEIKKHIDLFKKGRATYEEREHLFKIQSDKIQEKILELEKQKEMADYKIWYYQNMAKLGNEEDPLNCEKMRSLYENQRCKTLDNIS